MKIAITIQFEESDFLETSVNDYLEISWDEDKTQAGKSTIQMSPKHANLNMQLNVQAFANVTLQRFMQTSTDGMVKR